MKTPPKEMIASKLKGLSKEDLTTIIDSLGKINSQDSDLFPQDIFPEGIMSPDSARARFILTPEKHKKLIEILNSLDKPFFKDFKVFPLGIIHVDYYETQLGISNLR